MEAAAALELFHLAALVHDDVMDRSDDRRGRPTVHRAFADRHAAAGLRGSAEAYGSAVAVLVGDLCLTWSDDLATEAVRRAGSPCGAVARAVWSQMRDQVLAGQYLDVLSHARAAGSAATSHHSGHQPRSPGPLRHAKGHREPQCPARAGVLRTTPPCLGSA